MVDLQTIADALGKTRSAIDKRSTREGWNHSVQGVRGGRRKVFALADLPADVCQAVERHIAIAKRAESASTALSFLAKIEQHAIGHKEEKRAKGEENLRLLMKPLAQGVQARFDGRYAIVKAWEAWFPSVQPMTRNASFEAFAEAFNAGEIKLAPDVLAKFQPISPRSVQRYVLKFEKDGLAGLIDHKDGKTRKDVNVFTSNPALEKTAVALMISRPTISVRDMEILLSTAAVDQESGEVLFEAPSYWAINRFLKAWRAKNEELLVAATNPDEWKNKYMVAFGSLSADVTELNQRWEMDATPADWMLIDADGGYRRYSASVVIDVYSRRTLAVLSPTPRTETHKLALRLALMKWGVPKEIVTDNGKDYVSKEFKAVLDALKIDHYQTNPFSPWEKPHVERVNKTILHSVLDMYSSFIGHSVAERSAIEARAAFSERLFSKETKLVEMAMPAEQLQSRINEWLLNVYERNTHEGINTTPYERAAAYQGAVRRIENERALDVLLSKPAGKGTYVVTKKGLRFENANFIALELSLIVGKSVQLYLTEDYGQLVVYRDGHFVCIARCPERTGVSRQEIATHARHLQRQNIQEQRKAVKRTKVDPDRLVDSYLQHRAEAAGKLVQLNKPAQEHVTPGLTASAQAARALDGAVATSDIPADLRGHMERRQAAAAASQPVIPPSNVAVIPETRELRFKKWLDLDALLATGATIDDPLMTRWYGTYAQTAEFASMNKRRQESLAASEERGTGATVIREFKHKV